MAVSLTDLTPTDKVIVLAYAQANMRCTIASKITRYSLTNIDYHLLKVKSLTGLDPKRFDDLAMLVNAINEERKMYDEGRED